MIRVVYCGTDDSFCGINCPVLLGKHVVSIRKYCREFIWENKNHEKHVDMLFQKFEKFSTRANAGVERGTHQFPVAPETKWTLIDLRN